MIYLDNHASTPCDPRVVQAMLPYLCSSCGNPSGLENRAGREAHVAVGRARAQLASLVGAEPHEIVFTSGATESNNLAILGYARAGYGDVRNRIVTSSIEHKSVLEACRKLAGEGYDVIELPVDRKGRVRREVALEAINRRTLLVSIQAANNEIGTLQDIGMLSRLSHHYGAVFHCDAAQAVGKLPIDVNEWGVDFLSLSAHKMYGPKGIGALYVRGGAQGRCLQPLMFGGNQESGLRPGTLNVPAIAGFGEACRIVAGTIQYEPARLAMLRDRLELIILRRIPWLSINGDQSRRLPNNSSLTFPAIAAQQILGLCGSLALSTGSACNCADGQGSHVLTAIGLRPRDIRCTIRVGWGRFNSSTDPDRAAAMICEAIRGLQITSEQDWKELRYGRQLAYGH
jgi:cysteine desulfurase